ncbi:Sodium-dependent serotonin transporter [Trichinella pseudospiralis]|uniref:Transporter n=1 Tax=Trichinella pseudospiralis TaxID=6337 RepID=A0A0V1IAU1_TRIPS|nr:Sodium-dependent serotonin transporter [Trichinella pseudospiralis]
MHRATRKTQSDVILGQVTWLIFDFEQTEDRLHGYTIFGFQFPKGSVMIVLIVQIRKADRARDEPLTKHPYAFSCEAMWGQFRFFESASAAFLRKTSGRIKFRQLFPIHSQKISHTPESRPRQITRLIVTSCKAPSSTALLLVMFNRMKRLRKRLAAASAGEERLEWANKAEFLLAIIGFSVDLGNVWRFPYICYRNGGGAFLVPYFVMFIFCGLPLFYMEMALGQFHQCGCISIWKRLVPIFKGVGYATCLIDVYMGCFYNTIISWALFYLSSSFKWPFPWQSCDNVWNTENCIPDNATVSLGNTSSNYTNAAEEFFLRRVLEIQNSDGLENLGNIRWPLLLCLLVIYTIVYFAIWRGPLSSGKAVWFTATIPYVALFALLAHSCTLPGSQAGIKYFLMPDWSKLLNIEVWIDAATQIFFSLGPGFGVLIALASYNSRRNNFYRDAIVAGCINSLTSILSGLVIFSVLGYMADCLNKDIGEVAETGGPGLVFIVYPRAISTMKAAPVWSVIFFIMLVTLGVDSTFAGFEAILTAFCDEYPSVLEKNRKLFAMFFMMAMFFFSLPTVTYGGNYLIEYLDHYAVSYPVLIVVMVETVTIRIKRFSADVNEMLGVEPSRFLKLCWLVVCPAIVSMILIFATVQLKPLTLNNYEYPEWSLILGWIIRLSSIVCIPICIILALVRERGSLKSRLHCLMVPSQLPATSLRSMDSKDCANCSMDKRHFSEVALPMISSLLEKIMSLLLARKKTKRTGMRCVMNLIRVLRKVERFINFVAADYQSQNVSIKYNIFTKVTLLHGRRSEELRFSFAR